MKQGYTISVLRTQQLNSGKEISITKGFLNAKCDIEILPYPHSSYKAAVIALYKHSRIEEDDTTVSWYYEINKMWYTKP